MKSLYEAMTTVAPFLIKQKSVSIEELSGNSYTPLMFYDLKRNTSLQIETFRADMLVFRKSIFGGALNYISIWPIIPRNNSFFFFINNYSIFFCSLKNESENILAE